MLISQPPETERGAHPGGLTAIEWVEQHYRNSWHFEPALGRPDGDEHIYNHGSTEKSRVTHGQRVWFADYNGRIHAGTAMYNINNMWWIVTGRYTVRNVASFEIYTKCPDQLRLKRNAKLRRRRLESELAKAVEGMAFERAAKLRDILFPGSPALFNVWHGEHQLYHCSGFTPPTSSELLRQGWASPRANGALVHTVNRQMLILLATEKKLLPASVINQAAKARAAELEEAQGFAPGKKAMKELKERIADELLPCAFPVRSQTFAWIDPVNGWLVVDAASPSKADDVIKLLLKAVDRMPLESLRVQRSPVAVITAWLETDEAPAGFTVDRDAIMLATGESKASVRYVKHALEVDDLRRHIAAGKQCKRLAMTWRDKISFVLDETLAIKSVKPLDVIKENDASTRNDEERFDNDMMLMTGELAAMLADLVDALGAEASADTVTQRHQRDSAIVDATYDPAAETLTHDREMYDQAVAIVLAQRRASISLVQRHLRIGYNRAPRLLGAMEHQGIVSAMKSNGDRDILNPGAAA